MDLVRGGKIGYFALLRNLRNIREQAPEVLGEALATLTNRTRIRKALVLPFRFVTALDEIEKLPAGPDTREISAALNKALEISLANVPRMEGRTLVAVDDSGSMAWDMNAMRTAALFGTVLAKVNNADLMLFSDSARRFTVPRGQPALRTVAGMMKDLRASGTDFHCVLRAADVPYDRIIYLSDMQGWIGYRAPTKSLREYEARTGARPTIFSFDLSGYGSTQFPANRIHCIAGFSEKAFEIMKLLETDRNALTSEIEAIEL